MRRLRTDGARQVMTQQHLSPEALLARFFGKQTLSAYAHAVGKSPRGGSAVLAARISSHWQRVGVSDVRCSARAACSIGRTTAAAVATALS